RHARRLVAGQLRSVIAGLRRILHAGKLRRSCSAVFRRRDRGAPMSMQDAVRNRGGIAFQSFAVKHLSDGLSGETRKKRCRTSWETRKTPAGLLPMSEPLL